MEFYLGSAESVCQSTIFTSQEHLKHQHLSCNCTIKLANHHSGWCCNIFDCVVCLLHHEFYDGQLSTDNCSSVRQLTEEHWLLEASKELGIPVKKLRERNLPENNLYNSICSVTDEISRANVHKYLREHPNWQGFGSPNDHADLIKEQKLSWKLRSLNGFIPPNFLNY